MKKKTCEINMNILQSVTSHKSSRPTDTFQTMSQILEYFKLIEIIVFEKCYDMLGLTYMVPHIWSQPSVLEGKQILSSLACSFNEDLCKDHL